MPCILTKVINIYLKGAPEQLESIRQAVTQDDGSALERAAHSLKSSSANLGALQLSEICRELEMLGKKGLTGDAGVALNLLNSAFDITSSALSDELRKLSGGC